MNSYRILIFGQKLLKNNFESGSVWLDGKRTIFFFSKTGSGSDPSTRIRNCGIWCIHLCFYLFLRANHEYSISFSKLRGTQRYTRNIDYNQNAAVTALWYALIQFFWICGWRVFYRYTHHTVCHFMISRLD